MSVAASQEPHVLQDNIDGMNVYFHAMMVVRMVTLLSEAPPQCDVELFGQEEFTTRFVGYCQLYCHLDAADVPNFQMHSDIENVGLVLGDIFSLVALLEYDGDLFRDACFFLNDSVSK